MRERAQGARGANLVEFALALLVLFLVLGGIADLGRAFSTYIAIANAAREGARYGARMPCMAATGPPKNDPGNQAALRDAIIAAVTNEASTSRVDLVAMGCDIALSPNPLDGCAAWEARDGSPLVVTVSCDFESRMSSAPGLFGVTGLGNLTLTARGTMAIFGNEAQYSP